MSYKSNNKLLDGTPLDKTQIKHTLPPGSYYDEHGNLITPGGVNVVREGAQDPGTRVVNVNGKHVVLRAYSVIQSCGVPVWRWRPVGVLENKNKNTGEAAKLITLAQKIKNEKNTSWEVAAFSAAEKYLQENYPRAEYSYRAVKNLADWILAVKNHKSSSEMLNKTLENVREKYFREKSYVDAINHKLNAPATGEYKINRQDSPDFLSEIYTMFRGSAGPIAQFLAGVSGAKPGIVHPTPFTPPPPYANKKQYEEWRKKVRDYSLAKNLELEAGHVAGMWLGLVEASIEGEVLGRMVGKVGKIIAETRLGKEVGLFSEFIKEKTARLWQPLANIKDKLDTWYENYALEHGLIRHEVEKVTLPSEAEVHIEAKGTLRVLNYRLKGEIDVTDLYKAGLIPEEGKPGLLKLKGFTPSTDDIVFDISMRVPYSPKFRSIPNRILRPTFAEGERVVGFTGSNGGTIFLETDSVTFQKVDGTFKIDYEDYLRNLLKVQEDDNIVRFKGEGGNTPWDKYLKDEGGQGGELIVEKEVGKLQAGIPKPSITYKVVKEEPLLDINLRTLTIPETSEFIVTQLPSLPSSRVPEPRLFKEPENMKTKLPSGMPPAEIIFSKPQPGQKGSISMASMAVSTEIEIATPQLAEEELQAQVHVPEITVPEIPVSNNGGNGGKVPKTTIPMSLTLGLGGGLILGDVMRDVSKWFDPKKILGM